MRGRGRCGRVGTKMGRKNIFVMRGDVAAPTGMTYENGSLESIYLINGSCINLSPNRQTRLHKTGGWQRHQDIPSRQAKVVGRNNSPQLLITSPLLSSSSLGQFFTAISTHCRKEGEKSLLAMQAVALDTESSLLATALKDIVAL